MAIHWQRIVVEGSNAFPYAAMQIAGDAVRFASTQDEAIAAQTGLRRVVVARDTRVVLDNSLRQAWNGTGWRIARDVKSHPVMDHDDAQALRDA